MEYKHYQLISWPRATTSNVKIIKCIQDFEGWDDWSIQIIFDIIKIKGLQPRKRTLLLSYYTEALLKRAVKLQKIIFIFLYSKYPLLMKKKIYFVQAAMMK